MILTANIGVARRAVLDAIATKAKLTNADTLRMVVATGLGASVKDWMDMNATAAERREAAETVYGKRNPGPKAAKSKGKSPPIVTVRLPGAWAKRVRAAGGLKVVVLKGLELLENKQ